ncbi:MAG: DUF4340 domain-containing protein [Acidobacteriaceae bacterium]|nr:DUF4340 domain-containing protein [Acidobacteriaceae bacterium]MBV9778827.1 DUF4340 domain-containing protein [Acidobacteriaceae bacterium]
MKPRNLLIAAALLAALSGVVWWAKRHPQSSASTSTTPPSPKLADIPEANVKEIQIQKKDGPAVTLDRQNGKWVISAPQPLPADQDAATTVASSLSPLTADSVVEDKPANLNQYGLNGPSLTVTVKEKAGKTDQVVFGDDVPAGSLVYARFNSSPKVYTVSSSVKSSFDKGLNDLRDKRLLTFDTNQVTRVDIASPKADIEFGKNNQNDWQILKPKPYRADGFQVEELLRKLSDAKMDLSSSSEDTKKAAASFASGKAVGAAKVSDAAGTQTLEVHANKDDYYAKSSVVDGIYKISSDLGKEMEKPLDDFRNKKIFDFGFSDPTKIEVQRGDSAKTYTKAGQDWKLDASVMNPGAVQTFIDKLRDLSSTKFLDSGFTTPVATITVTSNSGKRIEKVEFAKNADGYIAHRVNEPALYQLDAKSVNDMLEASNSIKPAAPASKK